MPSIAHSIIAGDVPPLRSAKTATDDRESN
jgi:hypothetical protein